MTGLLGDCLRFLIDALAPALLGRGLELALRWAVGA